MKHRLNLDIKDPNYTLLKEIFKIMDSRETSEILTSFGFKSLKKQKFTFKIIFISMFFGLDIPFILNELESKKSFVNTLIFLKFGVQIKFIKLYHSKIQKSS